MVIVLRVSGVAIDVDAALVWIPPERLEKAWRIGDHRRVGPSHDTNGFTLKLGESESALEALQETMDALRSLASEISSVAHEAEHAIVDVALFVPGAGPRSVVVPNGLLALMSELSVVLKVTAYPCSDDVP